MISTNGIWLDLNCETDPEKTISSWVQATWIAIANKNWTSSQAIRFIEVNFRGIVNDWFAGLSNKERNIIISGNLTSNEVNENEASHDIITRFKSVVRKEFLRKIQEENQEKEEAKYGRTEVWNLKNLKVYNLCELEQYICLFQKYYCKATSNEMAKKPNRIIPWKDP